MAVVNRGNQNKGAQANKNQVAPVDTKVPAVVEEQELDIFSSLENFGDFKAKKGEAAFGLEIVDRSDLKLPMIRLMQSTSEECQKNLLKPGTFYNTVTEESSDTLECVLLVLGKTRTKWKKPFKRGDDPECRSYDSITKFDGSLLCSECEFQDWSNLPEGEKKPPCNMSYVWLGITKDKAPFRFSAAGSSVLPTKNFINIIAPRRFPPFMYKVTLSAVQEQNDQGIFYVVKYAITGAVGDDADTKEAQVAEAMALKTLAEDMQETFFDTVARDIDNISYGADGSVEEDGGAVAGAVAGAKGPLF